MKKHAVTVADIEMSDVGSEAHYDDSVDSPRRGIHLSDKVRYAKASMYLTNAMRGRLTSTDNLKLYNFYHSRLWTAVFVTTVVLQCTIIIFENPSTVWIYLVPHDEAYFRVPFGSFFCLVCCERNVVMHHTCSQHVNLEFDSRSAASYV